MRYVGGIDIGGTKCAVSIGCVDGGTLGDYAAYSAAINKLMG